MGALDFAERPDGAGHGHRWLNCRLQLLTLPSSALWRQSHLLCVRFHHEGTQAGHCRAGGQEGLIASCLSPALGTPLHPCTGSSFPHQPVNPADSLSNTCGTSSIIPQPQRHQHGLEDAPSPAVWVSAPRIPPPHSQMLAPQGPPLNFCVFVILILLFGALILEVGAAPYNHSLWALNSEAPENFGRKALKCSALQREKKRTLPEQSRRSCRRNRQTA